MPMCYKCGKKVKNLYEGLCIKCFRKEYSKKRKLPKQLEIKRCKFCGYFFYKRKRYNTLEEVIGRCLRDCLSRFKEIESAEFRLVGNSIKVAYTVKLGSKKITEEKVIEIKFKNIACAECQRRISEYYETKIQIRGNFPGDILNKIKDFLSKMKRKDAYISKVEELKEGIDLFVPSKSIGRQIANYIKRRYEVKVLITRKLYGLKDGKKVYKDTILVRFHD